MILPLKLIFFFDIVLNIFLKSIILGSKFALNIRVLSVQKVNPSGLALLELDLNSRF